MFRGIIVDGEVFFINNGVSLIEIDSFYLYGCISGIWERFCVEFIDNFIIVCSWNL